MQWSQWFDAQLTDAARQAAGGGAADLAALEADPAKQQAVVDAFNRTAQQREDWPFLRDRLRALEAAGKLHPAGPATTTVAAAGAGPAGRDRGAGTTGAAAQQAGGGGTRPAHVPPPAGPTTNRGGGGGGTP